MVLFTDKDDLLSYVPPCTHAEMKGITTDPLVYARFSFATTSFYLTNVDHRGIWNGYCIESDTACEVAFHIGHVETLMWDSDFTPCPLSEVIAYLEH